MKAFIETRYEKTESAFLEGFKENMQIIFDVFLENRVIE
jgi:hypothetical protein